MTAVTLELLEEYLPNPIRKSGKEYRTWLEPSRSRSHLAINLEEGVYYDFHTNSGGNVVSLLRQLGAPVSRELMSDAGWRNYQFQLSILKTLKAEGRSVGCGKATAIWRHTDTAVVKMIAKVMCLRWNCPYCAPFLRRAWMERLSGIHFGAVYTVLKGYKDIGRLLDRINRKAKRQGGQFVWLLLQANHCQILLIDSRSTSKVVDWLDADLYLERVATMPTSAERNEWLERGLETMNELMYWKNKVRHSRGLLGGDGDKVDNAPREYVASSPSNDESEDKPETARQVSEPKYEKVIVPYPIGEVVRQLEKQGYTVQWCSEEGNLAFVAPPRDGPI